MPLKRNREENSPENSTNSKKVFIEKNNNNMAVGNMSIEQLKVMLFSCINECVNPKFEEVAKKDDVQAIASQMQSLKAHNEHLVQRVTAMENYCHLLERQLDILTRKNNENTVVVHFPAEGKTNKVDYAKQTCMGLLHLQESAELPIKSAQEFTNTNTNKSTVILNFHPGDTANKVIDATPTLKNSGIVIHREQSLITRQKRKSLYDIKSNLLAITPSAKILIRGVKLHINNFAFSFNFTRGLIVNNAEEYSFVKNTFGDSGLRFFDSYNNNKGSYAIAAPPNSQHQQPGCSVQRIHHHQL